MKLPLGYSWDVVKNWEIVVAGAAALLTIISLVWKNTRAIWIFLLKYIQSMMQAPSQRRNLLANVNLILKELHPNGGESVRDCLDRLEEGQKATDKGLTTLSFRTSRIAARVLSTMENDPTPIWEADTYGNRTWANSAFLQLVNRPMEEIIGYGWVNSIHWDDRERVQIQWLKAIQEKRNFEESYRLVTPQGKVHKVSVVARPFIPDGELTSWIAHVTVLD